MLSVRTHLLAAEIAKKVLALPVLVNIILAGFLWGWFMHTFGLVRRAAASVAALMLGVSLSGCVTSGDQPLSAASGIQALAAAAGLAPLTYESIVTFQTDVGKAEFRRSRIDGSHEIAFQRRRERIPLPGLVDARIVGAWDLGRDEVLVVSASEEDCPVSYTLVAFGRNDYVKSRLGNCTSSFRFSSDDKWVLATEEDAADPEIWLYEDRRMVGPTLKSALSAPKPSQRAPSSTSGTRHASAAQQAPLPSRNLETVGDEVIPSAVDVPAAAGDTPTIRFD